MAALGLYGANMAHAAVYDLSGTTTGKPTMVVPFADGNSGPQPYDAFQFSVSVAGSYGLVSSAAYDNYTLLYANSFNPGSPLNNLIAYNDDYLDNRQSAVSFFLTTDTPYIFVNTAYEGSGKFTSTISGPGNVMPVLAAVPEPESIALMLAGMGTVVPLVRNQRRRRAALASS